MSERLPERVVCRADTTHLADYADQWSRPVTVLIHRSPVTGRLTLTAKPANDKADE